MNLARSLTIFAFFALGCEPHTFYVEKQVNPNTDLVSTYITSGTPDQHVHGYRLTKLPKGRYLVFASVVPPKSRAAIEAFDVERACSSGVAADGGKPSAQQEGDDPNKVFGNWSCTAKGLFQDNADAFVAVVSTEAATDDVRVELPVLELPFSALKESYVVVRALGVDSATLRQPITVGAYAYSDVISACGWELELGDPTIAPFEL